MAEYSTREFEQMKNEAAKRVMEMYKGSGGKMPPYPDFITLPNKESPETKNEHARENTEGKSMTSKAPNHSRFLKYLNFGELTKNKDGLLLIGLILLLSSEGADDLLILVLAYILL